jgi:hypothetical protein
VGPELVLMLWRRTESLLLLQPRVPVNCAGGSLKLTSFIELIKAVAVQVLVMLAGVHVI